jgi:hypothetical protein
VVPQLVQKTRRPCAGLGMALIWSLVIRGNKKPLVVDFKSRMAEALVPPLGFISIDCADATKAVKIESKISVFFITAGILFFICNLIKIRHFDAKIDVCKSINKRFIGIVLS